MSTINAPDWMKSRFPACKALDHDWTMERYDYPQEVRDWIKQNWVKVSDVNGGTYHEPEYHRERQESKKRFHEREEINKEQESNQEPAPKSTPTEKIGSKDYGKKFAQAYKNSGLSQGMNQVNKDALNVMASQGEKEAIKYMFTHPETGRTLSYSEMRSFYG